MDLNYSVPDEIEGFISSSPTPLPDVGGCLGSDDSAATECYDYDALAGDQDTDSDVETSMPVDYLSSAILPLPIPVPEDVEEFGDLGSVHSEPFNLDESQPMEDTEVYEATVPRERVAEENLLRPTSAWGTQATQEFEPLSLEMPATQDFDAQLERVSRRSSDSATHQDSIFLEATQVPAGIASNSSRTNMQVSKSGDDMFVCSTFNPTLKLVDPNIFLEATQVLTGSASKLPSVLQGSSSVVNASWSKEDDMFVRETFSPTLKVVEETHGFRLPGSPILSQSRKIVRDKTHPTHQESIFLEATQVPAGVPSNSSRTNMQVSKSGDVMFECSTFNPTLKLGDPNIFLEATQVPTGSASKLPSVLQGSSSAVNASWSKEDDMFVRETFSPTLKVVEETHRFRLPGSSITSQSRKTVRNKTLDSQMARKSLACNQNDFQVASNSSPPTRNDSQIFLEETQMSVPTSRLMLDNVDDDIFLATTQAEKEAHSPVIKMQSPLNAVLSTRMENQIFLDETQVSVPPRRLILDRAEDDIFNLATQVEKGTYSPVVQLPRQRRKNEYSLLLETQKPSDARGQFNHPSSSVFESETQFQAATSDSQKQNSSSAIECIINENWDIFGQLTGGKAEPIENSQTDERHRSFPISRQLSTNECPNSSEIESDPEIDAFIAASQSCPSSPRANDCSGQAPELFDEDEVFESQSKKALKRVYVCEVNSAPSAQPTSCGELPAGPDDQETDSDVEVDSSEQLLLQAVATMPLPEDSVVEATAGRSQVHSQCDEEEEAYFLGKQVDSSPVSHAKSVSPVRIVTSSASVSGNDVESSVNWPTFTQQTQEIEPLSLELPSTQEFDRLVAAAEESQENVPGIDNTVNPPSPQTLNIHNSAPRPAVEKPKRERKPTPKAKELLENEAQSSRRKSLRINNRAKPEVKENKRKVRTPSSSETASDVEESLLARRSSPQEKGSKRSLRSSTTLQSRQSVINVVPVTNSSTEDSQASSRRKRNSNANSEESAPPTLRSARLLECNSANSQDSVILPGRRRNINRILEDTSQANGLPYSLRTRRTNPAHVSESSDSDQTASNTNGSSENSVKNTKRKKNVRIIRSDSGDETESGVEEADTNSSRRRTRQSRGTRRFISSKRLR